MNLYEKPPKNVWRCTTPESPRKDSDSFMSIVVCGYGFWTDRGITELVHAFAYIYPSSPIEKIIEYTNDYYSKTVEHNVTGFSVKPPHFFYPVEVWDLSSGRYERLDQRDRHFTEFYTYENIKSPFSFFLGKKSVIVLCDSIIDDTGFNDLYSHWLPLMDDKTPRFLVESDYMDDGWSLEDDWIQANIKRRRPNESELSQKEFNCIKRFFCKVRDTQCTRDIFSYLLDFLSNISPKDESEG
ncbi:hypothetical protein CEE45_17295 [Candidatus Heimdallarchaeota archaeon B3_Heim]|nr:MAG: hypothetical protein CEE45_17295 [Candidatus Heimdallarchaeota archaeon B3_Heim]